MYLSLVGWLPASGAPNLFQFDSTVNQYKLVQVRQCQLEQARGAGTEGRTAHVVVESGAARAWTAWARTAPRGVRLSGQPTTWPVRAAGAGPEKQPGQRSADAAAGLDAVRGRDARV